MGNDERIDRRATGAQRVIIPDGNGGKQELIQINIGRAQMWMNIAKGFVALVLTIAAAMWGAVKFGVSSEVHTEVESAMEEELQPGGKIHYGMQDVALEAVEEIQAVLQDDLDDLDTRMGTVEVAATSAQQSIEHLADQNQRNADEIKMLLQEAITEARNDGGGG